MDPLRGKGVVAAGGGACVFGDEAFDGVGAEPASGPGGEQRFVSLAASFGCPGGEQSGGGGVERNAAMLAALAEAADVGGVADGDVVVVEAGELGDSEPGLCTKREKGLVSSSFPAGRVGGGEQDR